MVQRSYVVYYLPYSPDPSNTQFVTSFTTFLPVLSLAFALSIDSHARLFPIRSGTTDRYLSSLLWSRQGCLLSTWTIGEGKKQTRGKDTHSASNPLSNIHGSWSFVPKQERRQGSGQEGCPIPGTDRVDIFTRSWLFFYVLLCQCPWWLSNEQINTQHKLLR